MDAGRIVTGELFDQRLYLAGLRIHHGLIGLALSIAGAALMWHDRGDWPWSVRD